MRIRDIQIAYEDFVYRTPIKFGGVALDRVTLLNVRGDGLPAPDQSQKL